MCPRAPGASSPIRGFPMSRCPPPTRIRPAARLRESGGVGQDHRPRGSRRVPARRRPPRGHRRSSQERRPLGGELRGKYLAGLALSLEVMWDLAMEMLGKGDPVPYARCVRSFHRPSRPSLRARSQARARRRTAGRAGYAVATGGLLLMRWMRGAASASPHGRRCARWARRDRALRRSSAPKTCAVPAAELAPCRAPTSTSCPSRTRGSPAR
jgi:hypothetical protein